MENFPDKIARFRMTLKVHKDPPAFRPLVCCAGTFMNCWSRWIDSKFQLLRRYIPTDIASTAALVAHLQAIGYLPSKARFFTADAEKMYPNIDTPHALSNIGGWIDQLSTRPDFPEDFPVEAVKAAMAIVMTNNHFEFGDVNILQLIGTAMGTSLGACWASAYSGVHECNCLLPRYDQCLIKIGASGLVRWIDNLCGIWCCPHCPSASQCTH